VQASVKIAAALVCSCAPSAAWSRRLPSSGGPPSAAARATAAGFAPTRSRARARGWTRARHSAAAHHG
jgi:hypothetical protein